MNTIKSKSIKQFSGQFLDILGPILAGFQLTAALIGYVSVGALARWVLEVWFPFTRAVWQYMILQFKLPFTLTDLEKDALTTVAFFIPIAISGIIGYSPNREISTAMRMYALFTAVIFAWIVGGQLLSDVLNISQYFSLEDITSPIVIFLIAPVLISAIVMIVSGSSTLTEDLFLLLAFLTFSLSVLFLIYSVVSYLSDIGLVRTASILVFIALLTLSVNLSPQRLFYTLGAFLAFLMSSLTWEAILFTVKLIENFSSSFPT